MGNIEDTQTPEWQQFLAEREDVLTSLDIEKFRAYLRKYGEMQEAEKDERILLAGMHYARLNANFMDAEAKEASEKWLKDNGFNPYPYYV